MKKILYPVTAFVVALVSFTAVAHAATLVEPTNGSLLTLLQPILSAFEHGQKLYAGCLALVAIVALVRRFVKAPWVDTDWGAAGLTLVGSFAATLGAHLAGGVSVSWSAVWGALSVAFGAAGGYTMVKHLLVTPYMENFATKGPRWLHAPLKLVLWIFQEAVPDAPAKASGNMPAAPSAP